MANEDAFFVDDDLGLYAVADGMGGHNAGEVASQEAIDTLHGMVRRGMDVVRALDRDTVDPADVRKGQRLLESAVQAATYMVFGLAQHDPQQHGMGTTLSVLLLAGGIGITAQVGDSRIYLVRDGRASQMTEDHTLIAWQIKQGIISPEEAATSPHKNVITRAVGSREYVQVDVTTFPVQSGDAFLLCSDGLHGYFRDIGEIPPVVALGPVEACRRFIDLANERGGKDNITAVVVEVT
jgi:protein phosphatase